MVYHWKSMMFWRNLRNWMHRQFVKMAKWLHVATKNSSKWYFRQHSPSKYDDVIKWRHFPHYWPFVQGIHRSPVNSPHKGQWCGALMFSLICAWINAWVNNREAGDLRSHRAHHDDIVMICNVNRVLLTGYSKRICCNTAQVSKNFGST